MSELDFQAHHQHVAARLLDWNQAFSRDVTLHAPQAGSVGHRDKTAVFECVSAGLGNVSRGKLNVCLLSPGDLFVANLFHRSHELYVLGENLCTVNWENIVARIDVKEDDKSIDLKPLQAHIVTRTNEARAQRVLMGEGRIIAPYGDAQMTGGSRYDERGRPQEQLKVAVEEVVEVGPGSVVDGLFQVPTVKPGQMVMYETSVSPVRFTAGGQSFTLIHWRHVLFSFGDRY